MHRYPLARDLPALREPIRYMLHLPWLPYMVSADREFAYLVLMLMWTGTTRLRALDLRKAKSARCSREDPLGFFFKLESELICAVSDRSDDCPYFPLGWLGAQYPGYDYLVNVNNGWSDRIRSWFCAEA